MSRALTAHAAQITTAAVQINTLTVSGKQVTLAVFRQLREEPLIAEDGSLNGVPWGTVNYHPDKCGDAAEHVHVVWQRGTELLRSAIHAPSTVEGLLRRRRDVVFAAGLVVEACLARGMSEAEREGEGIAHLHVSTVYKRDREMCNASFYLDEVGPIQCQIRRQFAVRYNIGTYFDFEYGKPPHKDQLELVSESSGWAGVAPSNPEISDLTKNLRPTIKDDEMWQALMDLPQLFIAV